MPQITPGLREVRTFNVGEIRAEGDGEGSKKIIGYAAKFNELSEDLGGFREVIAPGAFANAIQNSDVRCLWDHLSHIVLGRNKSGTLRMKEDETGLQFECDSPDTQLVRDMVLSPISRGDVSQCSFGFRTITDSWRKQNDEWIRTLEEVELFDVSPVTYPAYQATEVALRSLRSAQEAVAPQIPSDSWQNDLMRRRLDLLI